MHKPIGAEVKPIDDWNSARIVVQGKNVKHFLNGIKVVEFSETISGAYCGKLLADLGADVIKIEPPEGDPARRLPRCTDGRNSRFDRPPS